MIKIYIFPLKKTLIKQKVAHIDDTGEIACYNVSQNKVTGSENLNS